MSKEPVQPELPEVTGEEIRHMSKDELREFVDGVVSGRIFTNFHIRSEHDLPMVFIATMFGGISGWSDTGMSNIGVIYEYLSEAGPTSINGYPVFFSYRLMNVDDWEVARKAIEREQERRKSIEI